MADKMLKVKDSTIVIPAKAGIHCQKRCILNREWTPAFADNRLSRRRGSDGWG